MDKNKEIKKLNEMLKKDNLDFAVKASIMNRLKVLKKDKEVLK